MRCVIKVRRCKQSSSFGRLDAHAPQLTPNRSAVSLWQFYSETVELTVAHSFLQFHFENMKLKAQQRIREGRPEPVEPLAVNLFLMPEFDASISAPHAIFIGLTLSEVEDVREDIMTWQASRQRLSSHIRSGLHTCKHTYSRQAWFK